MKKVEILPFFFLFISLFWPLGCQTTLSRRIDPDKDDSLGGTGIESGDVRTVAQKMSREIMDVLASMDRVPTVAIIPVKNKTRFQINTEIFTRTIENELISNSRTPEGSRVRFLARDRIEEILKEREGKRSGVFSEREQAQLAGADYFLTGYLDSISKARGGSRSDWIVCTFTLIDTETSDKIWQNSYETKKEGLAGTVYQ